ncbi:hypothetical protein RH915_06920 [Serpentinicella sp. ANB-PHB4]|uniref:TlpA family protein disulfide reductase n=1 Tax=Serpentinicella sp. ANB-PHB4 TaxID=3074076 RepID=UPI00285B4C75|nr:hypothetical protein [Serpentinicella sp. ANB-PHB4]MDR5659218.1 hypothetical protein [Serpentinicella sp. ANB-PHB4]
MGDNMLKNKYIVAAIIIMILFLNGCRNQASEEQVIIETFTLSDLNGQEILVDIEKPTILTFVDNIKDEEQAQISIFRNIYPLVSEEIEFIIIGSFESAKQISTKFEAYKEDGFEPLILNDETGSVIKNYNIKNSPTTLIIDREGVIIKRTTEVLTEDRLLDQIERLLSEQIA